MSLSPRSIQPLPVSSSLPSPSQTVFAGAFPATTTVRYHARVCCSGISLMPMFAESYTAWSMQQRRTKYGMLSSSLLKLTTHPKAGLRRRSHVTIPKLSPKNPSVRLDSLKGRPVLRYQNRPETRGTSEIPNVAYQNPKPNCTNLIHQNLDPEISSHSRVCHASVLNSPLALPSSTS